MSKLYNVRLDRPVEIYASIFEDCTSSYISGTETIKLNPSQLKALLVYLGLNNNLGLIEDTLQGLCETEDGTLLLTAFPSATDFIEATKGVEFIDKSIIDNWLLLGCNEININFEESHISDIKSNMKNLLKIIDTYQIK